LPRAEEGHDHHRECQRVDLEEQAHQDRNGEFAEHQQMQQRLLWPGIVLDMRTLLVRAFPRAFLLSCKLVAGTAISLLQVYVFLTIAWFWDVQPPPLGYLTVLPALILSGLMLGALGMLISSMVKQLENFAGVMNFVIFPMFFASSALYPLWRVQEASPALYHICQLNPFTHAVELIRFALYLQLNVVSLAVVCGCTAVFMIGAILAYDPGRGLLARRAPE
jgi:ABC-2 type transport system permease protein